MKENSKNTSENFLWKFTHSRVEKCLRDDSENCDEYGHPHAPGQSGDQHITRLCQIGSDSQIDQEESADEFAHNSFP